MAGPRLSIRIDLTSGSRIGPGKIALLEAIRSTGSISASARLLGIILIALAVWAAADLIPHDKFKL